MTDLQALDLMLLFSLGYLLTGLVLNLSDLIVAHYNRRLRETDKK